MSRAPIMIGDLKPEQNVWKISVRVIDVWTVKERNGQIHIEAIIQDVTILYIGQQIQVVTRSRELEVWTKTLQQTKTYMIYNGEALVNDMPLKSCDNEYKLLFNRSTTITAIDIPEIPQHCFHFKSFSDFLNGNFEPARLYDVIGSIQQVGRTQVAGAGKKACVNLSLADEYGTEFDMTLWESYAMQFMNFSADNGLIILILTHAWCRLSSSTAKLYISNAWNGSKLLLNHDHPQVDEFKTKFMEGNNDVAPSQSLSLNSCSQAAFDDRAFSFKKDVKSIAEMITLTEETFCNTVGETVRFRANPFGWYYEVCPTCNKTNQAPGGPFQCNCSDNSSIPITKYKIEIEVEYGSTTGNFVFWDKECIPHVGMSAHALRQLMKKTNEDHPNIYPEHLDHLLKKKFGFRAKYQPYYKQASIVRLTQDPDVIQQIEDALTPAQLTLTMPKKDELSKGKAILCLEDNNAMNTPSQMSNHTTTTSAAQNWSPEVNKNNTPSKRMSPPEPTPGLDAAEFSTPKASATKSARTKAGRQTKNKAS